MMDSFEHIVARWGKAPAEDLGNPPKTGGGGVQNQLYEKFKTLMFSTKELGHLAEMKELLKEKLVGVGGLVR